MATLLDARLTLGEVRDLCVEIYATLAVQRTKGDVTAAAMMLGVHRNTLHNLMNKQPRVREAVERRPRTFVPTEEELRARYLEERAARKRR